MALPWTDFVWSIKRWLSLHPLDAISSLPATSPPAGNYTIQDEDYYLVSTSAADVTYTLPSTPSTNRVLKFKNRGLGELTLSGSIFTSDAVASLILTTGDMATLTYDGTYWNAGEIDHHFGGNSDLNMEELTLQPGEWVTLAARAITGTPSYVTGSLNTREDQ